MPRLAFLLLLAACGPRVTAPTVTTTPKSDPPKGPTVESWAQGALLLPNLGTLHRQVSTSNKEAQAYFDQGLRLNFGFNHDEAARSFARAAQLDPTCASCFWGVALTLGPNYNVPMLADRAAVAWAAITRAKELAPRATPVEQALIDALVKRHKGPEPLEPPAMQPFIEAYAAAMREVAKKFPTDDDVQVLFAESAMNVNPWKLWSLDGKAAPGTDEIVSTIETVLARNTGHPGANHYYIHVVEASPHPEKALPSADRLGSLMPGAGHIVHMPAHIYQRVGRYMDATETNRKAVAVDNQYLAATKPPGYYPMYLGHNWGFLAYSASMEGRAADALTASRESARALPPHLLCAMPGMDFFAAEPLLVMVRFSKWDDLIAEPRPDAKYPVLTALWLHGHGMALAARGKLDDAQKDHAELVALHDKIPADMLAGLNPAREIAKVAAKILEARLAEARKQPAHLALWAEAVALEDKLAYSEPADWFYPVRHFHAAALLAAKKPKDAEAVYREDLKRNPGNGWALYGLAQSLKAQKKDASAADKDFKKAWARSDLPNAAMIP
jgi:tetratricopeptide (TPR) repeat protein